jgi:serine protease Do
LIPAFIFALLTARFLLRPMIQENSSMNNLKKVGFSGAALAAVMFAVAPAPARAQQGPGAFPPDGGAQNFSPDGFFRAENSGWLGVGVEEVTPDRAKELKMTSAYGVSVTEIGDNSPAAKAGLKKGDVITEYNGMRVEGTAEFRRLVRETPPGHMAEISVWRAGRTQRLSAEIGHAPQPPAADNFFGRGPALGAGSGDFGPRPQTPLLPVQTYGNRGFANTPALGVSAIDLSAQLGEYFGAPNGEGVLVTEVDKGSAGEKAGLKAGDVITKVDGETVRNVGELRGHLRDASSAKTVKLSVLRKGAEMSVTAELEMPHPDGGRPGDLDRRIPL